jgi:hypothetical protein
MQDFRIIGQIPAGAGADFFTTKVSAIEVFLMNPTY